MRELKNGNYLITKIVGYGKTTPELIKNAQKWCRFRISRIPCLLFSDLR